MDPGHKARKNPSFYAYEKKKKYYIVTMSLHVSSLSVSEIFSVK